MSRIINTRRAVVWVLFALSAVGVTAGLNCPGTGGDTNNPPVPAGNRPPWITITSIVTDFGNNFAEVGDPVTINFTGEDGEDAAVARIFASTSGNPTPQQEIPILGGFPVGPGVANGSAVWDTTSIPAGTYNVFAEIDDRTYDPLSGQGNLPVRVVSSAPVQVGPPGSQPSTSAPQLVFLSPVTNLGLSAGDELTLRYIFADTDSTATLTLLLDKDLNPFNDDINNPGDPLDPSSNIIILPSTAREPLDPTLDGDPPPPGTPDDPIEEQDSLQIRTNPRLLEQTIPGLLPFPNAPLAGDEKLYIFEINFSQIPPRTQPYFIRATLNDGDNVRHVYAVGSMSVSSAASGVVDVGTIGSGTAGARFFGFAHLANLGSSFARLGDFDFDSVDDFLIGSRFASPRGRPLSGAAYLIYGRRKVPFPPDTDGDGRPDGGAVDENGEIVNFPATPEFLSDPYEPGLAGRFGGQMSIEAVGSTPNDFIRGTIYAMPRAWGLAIPPLELIDPDYGILPTTGLTSIAVANLTGDDTGVEGLPEDFEGTIPDLVFGLPFVSAAQEYHDDDPADGCEDPQYVEEDPLQINAGRCNDTVNDDIWSTRSASMAPQPHMGIVIMTDGSNNTRVDFPKFIDVGMAGQFDPPGQGTPGPRDDEGINLDDGQVPRGARLRGGWFANEDDFVANGFIDNSGYGLTVSSIESIDNDDQDDFVISIPFYTSIFGQPKTGAFQVFYNNNFIDPGRSTDGVFSYPQYQTGNCAPDAGPCSNVQAPAMPTCIRCRRQDTPVSFIVEGAQEGDMLGWAGSAGDVNLDSNADIIAGAPGADRGGLTDNGVVYILYTGGAGFANPILGIESVANLQLWGSHDGDAFGRVQTGIQSFNGDNVADTVVASDLYDDNTVGVDAGFVGVIFGRSDAIGAFSVDDIGTALLPGTVFIGTQAGARAGASAASAGDFNGDGVGDLLISCPGETRLVGGQTRVGVAYLIFGGPQLLNQRVSLSQVGTAAVPGIVFISRRLPDDPTVAGDAETQAPVTVVAGIGDVDGDGFDDIMLGAPKADFVNVLSPSSRLLDAGEAYLIYGNNFGSNNPNP